MASSNDNEPDGEEKSSTCCRNPSSPHQPKPRRRVKGNNRQLSKLPHESMEFRKVPGDDDVLCGRGSAGNNAEGNRRFRGLVAQRQEEYHNASRAAKREIAKTIKLEVEKNNGLFLGKSKKYGGGWYRITDRAAIDKTAQALRDAALRAARSAMSDEAAASATADAVSRVVPGAAAAVIVAVESSDAKVAPKERPSALQGPDAVLPPVPAAAVPHGLDSPYLVANAYPVHDFAATYQTAGQPGSAAELPPARHGAADPPGQHGAMADPAGLAPIDGHEQLYTDGTFFWDCDALGCLWPPGSTESPSCDSSLLDA